jgi:hypothetical protein
MGITRLASVLSLLLVGGCASDQLMSGSPEPVPKTPDVMAGRWILSAPNAPSCGMNFSGAVGARDGRVAPEGGCPERFFLSRRWSLDRDALAISDGENAPLAQLKFANGHFEGQSASGTPVVLSQ